MRVRWRIEIAGREPYEVEEERDAPAWTAGGGLGGGNRWYKVRVRPQFGLMKLGVPCFVNPGDPAELWIDWDAAYDAHEPAWEHEARIRRGVGERSNLYDRAWERLSNPLAGKARAEDELAEVERRVEAEKPPPPRTARAAVLLRAADGRAEAHQGHRAQDAGDVTRHEATNREMFGSPVVMLHFDVEGREIVFEHCYGWRHLKRYKVGRTVDVWIDPQNPDALCPGE